MAIELGRASGRESVEVMVGGVGRGIGEGGSVVVQRVDSGVGVVQRIGVGAVGIDFEGAELAGDIGGDAGGLAIHGGYGLGAGAASVVGEDIAGGGVRRGVFGNAGGIGRYR